MSNTYEPGRSRWTRATGRLMVISAAATVGAVWIKLDPYPPLKAELALTGITVFFAGCWIAASHRARTGPAGARPALPPAGQPSRGLSRLLAVGTVLAGAAALLLAFTVTGDFGREQERLERAGIDAHRIPVARVLSTPEPTGKKSASREKLYTADLAFQVPYDDGEVRELVLRSFKTIGPPEPGMKVDLYYARGHPEIEVRTGPPGLGTLDVMLYIMVGVPALVFAAGALKAADARFVHTLRRFHARVHLPAFGILLVGVALLLPVALESRADGFARGAAGLAALTPWLALRQVRRAGHELGESSGPTGPTRPTRPTGLRM
ncbi:hypothetical protein [Streptomyces sp. NBC_00454]|uniref:hypothetical protein n=1 Tax=Streptomyces sp. NBC_00454 TaxID=2975747 RepID=UPI00324CED03